MKTSTTSDGKTEITFGHNTSNKPGHATTCTFVIDDGGKWDSHLNGFYKWDTKPDVTASGQIQMKAASNSAPSHPVQNFSIKALLVIGSEFLQYKGQH